MTSTVTAFTPIPERSDATPGLFNSRLQQLQDNQSSAVADLIGWNKGSVSTTVDFSAGTLSTNTIRAASGNTVRLPNGHDLITRSIDSGGAVYHIEAFGDRNSVSVNSAVAAAYAAGGGLVELGHGSIITVVTPILARPGVVIQGSGSGDYSNVSNSPTVLRPSSAFTGAAVYIADPLNVGGGLFITGVGLERTLVDMTSVSTWGVNAVELRSVSNAGQFDGLTVINQDSGQYLKVSQSTYSGAQVSDGITIRDFYGVSKSIDPANTDPTVLIESTNEITFLGARTKVGRKSNGTPAAGTVALLIRSQGSSPVNGVLVDGASITGCETGIKTSYVSGAAGVRYVRVQQCTFEVFNTGILYSGDTTHLTQHSCIGPGNRFISANTNAGTPSNIKLDYAGNCLVLTDQVSATSGYAVILTAKSSTNHVVGGLGGSTVSNQGTDNAVWGAGISGQVVIGTGGESAPGVAIDASATGTPIVRWLRAGIEKASHYVTSALGTDELLTSIGTYLWRWTPSASLIAPAGGTINLATNAAKLSMRTLGASSVTASAANTNLTANEVLFTVGGASGASLAIHSGGTVYLFNSALSAKAT